MYASDSNAFGGKLEEFKQTVFEKDQTIESLRIQLDKKHTETLQMSEELHMYQGRCSNLQRDLEL
jgi:hypothetical protein